ncbi:PREDICTED: serine/threonine-protein kinase EDR1-like isoform X2 [Tarenaya hassleriana]|uniref:serine/threonine-protein kinase EDR1-like isoform X2 n=1 Tax=Tarenaya hassleriana TaxID=28532 RepID=UPI00053C92A1|nr:PREDICTED: serine/threonine-protein kinase EDR1-like isoform X2 [Tarenaya hassleriana]
MPKMKHLLRKLHMGSAIGDHHRLDEPSRPVIAPSPIPTPSPIPASTSSVSSSGSAAMQRLTEAEPPVTRDRTAVNGVDFNMMEEEFQVQLAMAISVSNPDSRENADTAEIDAAKRISLGVPAPLADSDSVVDFLSLRYWGHKAINYDEKVKDGFYDVYGITSNSLSLGRMPLLVDLQAKSISEHVDYEVILVNRLVDPELRELERRAYAVSLECLDFARGLVSSDLIQNIASMVVEKMGGPVENADEMVRRWTLTSYELRNSLNSIILPLGSLDVGLARHRALLFKVLADGINLPCMLVKGSYYTGIDDGAVNLIKLGNGSEYIIDLMGAPGALIPTEVPSSYRPISCPDSRVFSDSLNTLETSRSVLDNETGTAVISVPETKYPGCDAGTDFHSGYHKDNNDKYAVEKHQTERFEHDFGKLMQTQQRSGENMPVVSGKPTSAQKVKVKNISKYVISAAKNPEFAQKLHAVLLESGASPPPHLLMDINPKNLREQKQHQESSSCMVSDVHCNLEKIEELAIEQLRESETGQNSDLCTSAESYQAVEVHCSTKRNFDVNNFGEVTAIETMETKSAAGETSLCNSHDQGINPLLGDAAKWEILWEDLRIGERIGIGSYGEVYHAEWNGTEVAVKKFLDQDFSGDALTQFKSEVEIMLRLRHPNIVLFMGAVTRLPHFSILTEFLPRGSLYRLLHRPNTHLAEKRRMRMALDVAKGLNYLHTSHPIIVHRDLKSPNLLVDKNWVVKVCDFGLSRMKHHTFLSSKSTAGTPEWMAPEVLRNEPASEKCDVYSFGVILWELATRHIPWKGLNPMQVVGAVGFQNRRPEIPEHIDPTTAQIIRECWQTEPHLRPSFTQLMHRLKRLKRLTMETSGESPGSSVQQ